MKKLGGNSRALPCAAIGHACLYTCRAWLSYSMKVREGLVLVEVPCGINWKVLPVAAQPAEVFPKPIPFMQEVFKSHILHATFNKQASLLTRTLAQAARKQQPHNCCDSDRSYLLDISMVRDNISQSSCGLWLFMDAAGASCENVRSRVVSVCNP